MTDLIKILESFNRKERFFLVAQALGCSNSGEPAFSLSDSFRKQLNANIDVAIPLKVFVAMDYHLDWLQAALTYSDWLQAALAHSEKGELVFSNKDENKDEVIEGKQRDVDFLVAFKVRETFHLILVEAKAYSDWDYDQLLSKAKRLRTIFGEDGKKWNNVQPYFRAMGPKNPNEPERLKLGCLPKWMLNDDKLQWLHLQLPKRRMVSRCGKDNDNVYQQFKIISVRAP